MESVKRAKNRLAKFPMLLKECGKEGLAYAACVSATDDPKHLQCQKEFLAFRSCLTTVARTKGIKI